MRHQGNVNTTLTQASLLNFKEKIYDQYLQEFNNAILNEIARTREKSTAPFVDNKIIKTSIQQYIIMKYGKNVKV